MARELQSSLLSSLFGTIAAGTVPMSTISNNIRHAKTILEFIGDFPEWINYNRNLEEHTHLLRTKMICLEGVHADVETQIENTELQNGKKRKREVDHWLKSVKKKADDVTRVESAVNSVHYLPRFLYRAWLGSCIGDEIQQVSLLLEQGKFPEGLLLDAPQDGGEPFVTSLLVGQTVHEKISEIWSHINHPGIIKIGVQGPEGIGKTAVMMEVYNQLCSSSNYRVYYVNVPRDFSVYSLQSAITTSMRLNVPQIEGSENMRAARIFNVLKSMKDYVIILDGLLQFFLWEEVGIPVEGNAGKLVLTSRSPDVCRRMLCHETVVLERLSRQDSEMLFKQKLTAGAPIPEEIWEVAENIIRKCNGVPWRIVEMAIQMRGVTDINEWSSTLNEM